MEEGRSFDVSSPNENEKVVINVGGQRHETYTNTLKSIPDTRLFWITENPTQLAEYDPNTHEYFFDRHPSVFAQVLNFYRTGKLHCPNDVCGPLFEEELAFWGIDELQVEPCCWLNYKKHREAQTHLDPFEGRESDGESVEDMDMSIYGLVGDSIRRRNRTCWKTYQPKLWTLFEEPYSSIPAQILAFVTLFLIITSVAVFCLETMPYFSDPKKTPYKVIYYIEAVCVAAFTLEFIIRLIVCPNKLAFIKVPMNWIDFGAILPFYLQLMLNKSNVQTMVVFRVIRLIRVFRIFKLSRHSYGLQILGHTLKSSCSELFLLAFFLSIGVVIFSSIIYYAEKDEIKTHFKTIPHGFWWAVVTMTTLGYGDMVPQTAQGKLVGSLCAVSGVLMIALPVPVIVSNFSLYYSHAKARMNLPKRKRPLIFGAASALRVAHPFAVAEKKPNVITQLMEERGLDDDDPENPGISRRTPRNSGRLRSPRTLHPSSTLSSQRQSPRGSVTSQQEPRKNSDVVVHEVQGNTEPNEKNETRRSSCTPLPIPQLVLSASGDSDNQDTSSQPKSPVSIQLSDNGSVSSLADKIDPNSSASKKRPIQIKSLSADSCQGGSPRGRRGRRGSIYIVGFTAKHWQNKVLNKNKDRKTLSADNSTEMDETRTRGMYYSLSCETCDTQRKARSAEVLLPQKTQSNSQTTEKVPPVRPRRDSITIQSNPRIVTHKSLTQVSSGTQTPGTREGSNPGNKHGIKYVIREESRKTLSDPVKSSSKSLVEHDSSFKTNDDSLCVHRHLNQRRGSSPLRRQHAVFTFDVNEPTSPKHLKDGKLAPLKVVNQCTSPTLPSLAENNDNSEKHAHESDKNSDLTSPPLSDTMRNSVRNTKVRPKSLSSSYVNTCYQKEEDDPISLNQRPLSTDSNLTFYKNREAIDVPEKRGFQPYHRDRQVTETMTHPRQTCHSDSELDETDNKDHYSRGRRTPLGSVSNTSLPSISEERADHGKHNLHRPHSMPSEKFERSIPLLHNINRASSLPLGSFISDGDNDVISNHLHPDNVHGHCKEQRRSLLQRRQGPDLSLDSTNHSLEPKQLEVLKNPWFQSVSNSSRSFRTVDGVISVSDLDHFTSGPSPLASGDYSLSADERLLFSPHTPPSLNPPRTRDMATSPFITVWNESEDGPDPPSGDLHIYPTSEQFANKPEMQWKSTALASELKDNVEERNSPEYELQPIRRVEDQAGQKYTLYAVPTRLEGSVYYSSANINSNDVNGTQSSTSQNRHRDGSETFVLPSGSIYDHFGLPSERLRDHSEATVSQQTTDGSSADHPKNTSPSFQKSCNSATHNSHEPLQQKLSGNLLVTKRPASLPSPDRRKARTLFFGDSGISSVGSGSTTSMSHSLELDTDSKDRKETAANLLNPIKETEVENPGNKSTTKVTDPNMTSQVNIMLPAIKSRDSAVIDILTNSDLYEASIV